MNYQLISISSSKLKIRQINSICILKDKYWKFGIKSQKEWYKKNVKKNDIHNLFYIKSKLAGYTLLRKRTCESKILGKRINYFLFDTFIIDPKFRKKKLSDILMNFNNTIINQSGYFSFLLCENKMINFYEKYKWKRVNKTNVELKDHLFSNNGMVFNTKKKYKKFILYFKK